MLISRYVYTWRGFQYCSFKIPNPGSNLDIPMNLCIEITDISILQQKQFRKTYTHTAHALPPTKILIISAKQYHSNSLEHPHINMLSLETKSRTSIICRPQSEPHCPQSVLVYSWGYIPKFHKNTTYRQRQASNLARVHQP